MTEKDAAAIRLGPKDPSKQTIAPSCWMYWNVHLDGLERTHDLIVEREGVFKECILAIKMAKELGYQVAGGHRPDPASSPRPTPTTRSGPRCGRWSTRPGAGPRSTASPSCTPAPSPTPGWSTSSWRPPASPPTGRRSMPLTRPHGRPDPAAAARPAGERLPAPGRLRLAGRRPRPARRQLGAGHRLGAAVSRDAGSSPGASSGTTCSAGWPTGCDADADAGRRRPGRAGLAGRALARGGRPGPGAARVRPRPDRRPRRRRAADPRRWGEHARWAREHARADPRRRPAAATAGRRPSARPPNGWSGPSTGWPPSTRSRDRSGSTCSPAPSSSSSRATSGGSAASARASWSARSPWASGSTSTWSSSSAWPKDRFPSPVRDDSLLPDDEREAAGG